MAHKPLLLPVVNVEVGITGRSWVRPGGLRSQPNAKTDLYTLELGSNRDPEAILPERLREAS